jgi:hypothetical protein
MENISVNINTEQEQKKTSDVPALCQKAELTISNQGDYEIASTILSEVKSRYKELDSQRKEITKPIDTAKKAVMDLFKTPLELLEKAESKIKGLMIGYTNEQERKAREGQARLQKLADQEAAKQKKILDEKIARAEASGKTEKAEELQMQKETITPIVAPVITPQIETPKGVSYREQWSAEVIDINLVPREWLIANLPALNKTAQATKGTLTIPGVKFISTKILASR